MSIEREYDGSPEGNEIAALETEVQQLRLVLNWVEAWVSNPVGSYSVYALDGLFKMTREKIEALRSR